MKTLTVDDYQRVRLPAAKPRSKFAYEASGNVITLTELVEKDVPLVKTRKASGFVLVDANLDRAAIRAAIRADREAR
jgi:hypothetical protein